MDSTTVIITLRSGLIIRFPAGLGLPTRGWSIHNKGYVIYTSRGFTAPGLARGARLHREVMKRYLGRDLAPDEHVHHQDHDKLHNCGHNLILCCCATLNPTPSMLNPFTGFRMNRLDYLREFGWPASWGPEPPELQAALTRRFGPRWEDMDLPPAPVKYLGRNTP